MSNDYRKDEYKKVQIPFGFDEKLQRVFLSLFHTFFVAMTGHGKTLGMKSLLLRFHKLFPDWKILIIDSKDKRDYQDLNADIPICFVETTEPLDLKNLLEPVVGAKMMYYFDKIIEEAIFDTLGEIQRNIEKKITSADEGKLKIHGKELGKLRVLNHLLKKLVSLVEQPNIQSTLELHEGFNVMAVSLPHVKNPNLKRAFQQLIVRSTLILLLSDPKYEKTLLVLDENHKWNPQRYSSICKQPLSEFISEGRSQDKIVWQSDQALTKVDKESLKNVKVWIVGQQMESNEVDDAVKTVNDTTDLSVTDQDIKSLKVGHWILVDGLHGEVHRAYLQPYGVSDSVAERVVKENNPDLAEPFIIEYEKSQVQGDDDLVYKEKFEKLQKEFEESERTRKGFEKLYTESLKRHDESLRELTEKLGKTYQKEIDELKIRLGRFENLEKALADVFVLPTMKLIESIVKEEVAKALPELKKTIESSLEFTKGHIEASSKTLNLEASELTVNLFHSEEPTNMNTESLAGKIMWSAINDMPKEGFTEKEIRESMAKLHGWDVPHENLAPQLSGNLIRLNLLYRVTNTKPQKYAVPQKRKINVVK